MVRIMSPIRQLLGAIPRTSFESLVARHGAKRGAKGYSTWSQLVPMLFCQLARAYSLRNICNGLARCMCKLSHLGVAASPKRSTLSCTSIYRPAALFEEMFWTTVGAFRSAGRMGQHKPFRFRIHLASLDSTTISPGPVRVSQLPTGQERREAPRAAQSPGLPAGMAAAHLGAPLRHPARAGGASAARVYRRHGPRPQRLVALRPPDERGGLLRSVGDGVYGLRRDRHTARSEESKRRSGRNHPAREHRSRREQSPRAASRRLFRPREGPRDRPADEPPRVWCHHVLRHIQGSMEARTALQSPQAKPETEDFGRGDREGPEYPDLYGPAGPDAPEAAALGVPGILGSLEPAVSAPPESVHLPRSHILAR